MNDTKHKCDWDTVTWKEDFIVTNHGEIINVFGKCKICNKTLRKETYISSNISRIVNNRTNKVVSL